MTKNFLLFLFLPMSLLFGETRILEFANKSLRENSFFFKIEFSKEELKETSPNWYSKFKKDEMNFNPNSHFRFQVNEAELSFVENSLKITDDEESLTLEFLLLSEKKINKGKLLVTTKKGNFKAETEYEGVKFYSEKNKQPSIDKIFPAGGVSGDTIQIFGKNFGNDLDAIQIVLIDPTPDVKSPFDTKILGIAFPFYLAGTGDAPNETQSSDTMKFTISPSSF